MKEFTLHPATSKYLKLGHFWVTLDTFSKKIPHDIEFFIGIDGNKNKLGLFFNDPHHKEVKARLWKHADHLKKGFNFEQELEQRIEKAITKRKNYFDLKSRDHFYLAFGESDLLPGLLILKLGPNILIQSYSAFWKKYLEQIKTHILKYHNLISGQNEIGIWFQERDQIRKNNIINIHSPNLVDEKKQFVIQEFGANYLLDLNTGYDIGIYTDMAEIRFGLTPNIMTAKSVLNLFSYTGAFSVYALKLNVPKVVSVDLSSKYLDWLDHNIALNPTLEKTHHSRLDEATTESLKKLQKNNETFDLIICDPPSSSSDGDKRVSALKSYDEMLPLMEKVLSQNGELIAFLNTHSISWKKFEQDMIEIISKNKLNLYIVKKLNLGGDCPRAKGFIEGDYLKGLVIKRK